MAAAEEHEDDCDTRPPIFEGVRFALLGYDAVHAAELRSLLEGEGAQEVVDASEVPPGCTHLITAYNYDDPACLSARQAKVVVVRALWVEHCMRHGPVSPHRVVYQPPRPSAPLAGAASLQISLTGYKGIYRTTIMALCEQMGAVYTKELSAGNTHLICYEFKGEKYNFARERELHLVNHRWLEDSLRLGALQPEEHYTELSGQEVEAAEEAEDPAAEDEAAAQEKQCKAEGEVTGDERHETAGEGVTGGTGNEAEPMQEDDDGGNMQTEEEALQGNVEEGSKSGGPAEENVGSVRPERREGWKAAGATVRVQKGLGYLAGSAQPPGWEEKERGTSRGSPKGVQKYLDEMSSLASGGAEKGPLEGGGWEEEGGKDEDVSFAKMGLTEKTAKSANEETIKGAAEPAEPMRSVPEGEAAAEVEVGPAVGKAGGGRLKKVGEAACLTPVVESGGANGVVPLEEEEEEEGGPAQASSKKGRKRGKRILLESDESSQEGAADAATHEPTRPEAANEEQGEEKEDGMAEPVQGPVQRELADEGGSEGSGDEAIACLAKGNKRKKVGQGQQGTAKKAAANKRKKKGSEASGAECEQDSRSERDGTKGGSANGDEAVIAEASERKQDEQTGAMPEQGQRASSAGDEQEALVGEEAGQPAEPKQDEEMETEAAGEPKSAAQRSPLAAAAAGLGRTPGKNALVRAKPKPIVRRVGGKPNRAFRPPARVKAAETESGQEGPAKKPKGGAKKAVPTKAAVADIAEEAEEEDAQQGGLQPSEGASQEEEGQAGKRKGGPADGDEQGEKKVKSGKKKRKLASNGSVVVGRRSEEMVTPAKGAERKSGSAGGAPEPAAEPTSDDLRHEAAGGGPKPEEECGTASALDPTKTGAGVVEKECEGGKEKKEGKQSKKGGKKPQGVKKGTGEIEGGDIKEAAKADSLIEANKENIKSEAEKAAAQGVSCEAKSSLGGAQTAPYFAFGGSGEQKDSMVKKVKALGGRVARLGHEFDRKTTHVVHPPPLKRTEKVLAALAAGLWLLQPAFLTASKPAGGWATEEEHEWVPGTGDVGAALDLSAPRHWRQRRAETGRRALQGLRVVLYGDFQNPTTDALKRIVLAGGGQVLASGPGPLKLPAASASSVQVAIIGEGVLSADVCVTELLAAGAGCVNATWLLDTLSLPRGDHSQHVLFGTEAAVAAALESVNSAPAEPQKGTGKGVGKMGKAGPKAKGVLQPHSAGGSLKTSAKTGKKAGKDKGTAKSGGSVEAEDSVLEEEDDVACGVCGRVDQEAEMVLCDGRGGQCDLAVHIFCMAPPLKQVPEGDWFCSICQEGQGGASP
ncbi:BRCT domain-containing protein [Klebsormidium nitens]|uniref:BRCT domain-containing protein n=1 Tax=Klebsormidium nitens TaxID=105231 RepID=A0A1Y1IHE0_KLENI|nr:BRCT domain-containing protein [Klebsormidium nitens]|eukprot:GAQ87548.1 BRCT domain-containing protein [Klebsormidium nitens]